MKLKKCPFCGAEPVVDEERGLARCSKHPCAWMTPEAWNRRVDDWQPIETAPRDETRVLAIDNGGWFDVVEWCLNGDPGWIVCHEYYVMPTHWRPLPEPPEVEGDE